LRKLKNLFLQKFDLPALLNYIKEFVMRFSFAWSSYFHRNLSWIILIIVFYNPCFSVETNRVLEFSVQSEDKPHNSWTFGICTDGKTNIHYHAYIINSIKSLGIPCFEIIFATENPNFNLSEPNVRVLHVQTNRPAHITLKKNKIAEAAKYTNLCMMHDYMVLDRNWFKEFNQFGYDWTVCSNPFLTPDGNRWADWVTWRGPRGHTCNPYDMPADRDFYVPGMYFCVKREFLLQYPLDERLIWGGEEDVEWSSRICDHWHYVFNPKSIALSLKQK
jgi:hypothetical protein